MAHAIISLLQGSAFTIPQPSDGASWVPPGCLWVPLVPPSPVWGRGCLRLSSGQKHIFQLKCSHEMSIEIIAIVGEKWSHNGCPKLEECDKHKSGITKKTGLEHVYMKVTKSVQIDALRGLILMLPLARNHCFHFSRFAQTVTKLVAKNLRN